MTGPRPDFNTDEYVSYPVCDYLFIAIHTSIALGIRGVGGWLRCRYRSTRARFLARSLVNLIEPVIPRRIR